MKKKETPLESFNRMRRESKVNKILSNLPVSGNEVQLIDFLLTYESKKLTGRYKGWLWADIVEDVKKSINYR